MKSHDTTRIYLDNIDELSRRMRITELQRALEVSELIDTIIKSSRDGDYLSVFNSFAKTFPTSAFSDRAMLCQALASSPRHSAELQKRSCLTSEGIPAGAHGKVSIVRNRYNEEAYSVFSEMISNSKVAYAVSFTEACEDVFDGRCEFCILPVESSQSGRLFGFYSMLDRYELKICALCELDGATPTESTKYALVGRSMPDRIPKKLDWRFECAIISGVGRLLGDISSNCEALEARLIKIDSLSVEYNERLQKYYFTFEVSERGVAGLDLLLSEEYATYVPLGLYPVAARERKD